MGIHEQKRGVEMKRFLVSLLVALLVLSPLTLGVSNSVSTNIVVDPEGFEPLIWLSTDGRITYRDPASGNAEIIERTNNYAFEGEMVAWLTLVMDKNGIEDINSVTVTVGPTQVEGNPQEVTCSLQPTFFEDGDDIRPYFNARIGEEQLEEFDSDVMGVYLCALTVETPNSMYGEYWIVGEVEDADGNKADFDENEYWFFNPVIALSIDGTLGFDNVRPGSASYSDTLRISNDADEGSGVVLDMTISGTDFYDPSSSGAKCPVSNRVRLNSGTNGNPHDYSTNGAVNPAGSFDRGAQTNCDNPAFRENGGDVGDDLSTEEQFDVFCYFATNGAYKTSNDNIRRDIEGYVGIPYETGEQSDRAPIISSTAPADRIDFGSGSKEYFAGNVLTPGADMAVTFRLFLPEPCNGEFSDGQIYFWGEAI